MAEPVQDVPGAAVSPSGIKQEREPTGFEHLDFTMSPELAAKRPLEHGGEDNRDAEAKRPKTETVANGTEEESLEDDLALLVQNALSNVGDLVGHFGGDDDPMAGPNDPMDLDGAEGPESFLPHTTFLSDPDKYLRDVNLYAFGNLALSLLLILLQQPNDETLKLIRDHKSSHGRSYGKLKLSFERVRDIYTTAKTLSANELEFHDLDYRNLIDLANFAQLGSWLVDGGFESFCDADTNFLSIFQCRLSDLPVGMADLYLEVKTQRAIEALLTKDATRPSDEVIHEVLIQGLGERLRSAHGEPTISDDEQNFVTTVHARKDAILESLKGQPESAVSLKDKYPSDNLFRNFAAFARPRLASASDLGDKYGVYIHLIDDAVDMHPITDELDTGDLDLDDLSSFFEKTTSGLVQNVLAGLTEEEQEPVAAAEVEAVETRVTSASPKPDNPTPQTNGKIDFMTDYKELEALVAESTSNYVKTTLHGLSPVPYQPTVPTSTTESMAAQLPYLSHLQQHQAQHPYYTSYTQQMPEPPPAQPPGPGENLPPNQTFPSAILYDKARQAALSKSSSHTRREGLHSTRRPWTQEEEKALMAGLDMVKGPHWSQILTLFGQHGTISDILKDRTQVQLKDKARNLKLFFLKTNSEMPYYLQAVTGELKTRAPTQAARKEAEERARLTSEEDQAKLQGIMALAGGLQHPPHQQNRATGSPATAVGSSVVTPAQAASAAQASSSGQQGSHVGTSATAPSQTSSLLSRVNLATAQQPRPTVQATSQQTLHSMPHPPPRPQTQLPPQVPRPQAHQSHQLALPKPQHYQPQQTAQQQQPTQGQPQLHLPQQPQPQSQQQAQPQAQVPSPPPQQAQSQVQAQPSSQPQQQHQPQQTQQTQRAYHPSPHTQSPAPLQISAQNSPLTESPAPQATPQNTPQHPSVVGQSLHSTANSTSPTPPATSQPQQIQHNAPVSVPSSQPAQQLAPGPTYHAQAMKTTLSSEAHLPQEAAQHNDNAAEAALLEGLQAVVAQTSS